MATLGSSLNLPLISDQELDDLLTGPTDYSVASKSKKTAEAVMCLKNTGQLDQYANISSEVSVVTSGGVTSVTNNDSSLSVPVIIGDPDAASAQLLKSTGENRTKEFKVKLAADSGFGIDGRDTVTFNVMPTISESGSASYEPFNPLHHPGEILKYSGSPSRSWSLSGIKLISRTSEEATENLMILNIIRSWRMPYYGVGTESDSDVSISSRLGAPPPILTFSAFGENTIGPVKCVMESYSTDWPNDVDYINTLPRKGIPTPTPFPVILTLSINLKETWSPAEYSGFDLRKYRSGDLPAAFTAVKAAAQQKTPITTNVPQTDVDYSNVDYSNEGRNNTSDYSNEGRNRGFANEDYSNEGRNKKQQPRTLAAATSISGFASGARGPKF